MTIRIGVVGFGSAGKQHIHALNEMEEVDLACVLEKNLDIDLGGISRASSWQELLSDTAIDAIALCIPPGTKGELAKQAIIAGKSVLLEKPPCKNLDELCILRDLAENNGVTIGVMFQHRYIIPTEVLSWKWNEKTTAILEVSRPRKTSRYFNDWRANPKQALGGIFAHLGVHYIDLACYILGTPITHHQVGKREFVPGIDMRVVGTIEFDTGAALAYIVTSEAEAQNERLTIFSDNKKITIENGHLFLEYGGKSIQISPKSKHQLRQQVYLDFTKSILNGRQPVVCHLEGARGITMLIQSLVK
ncbi:Gfo/Idh/MocA family oxidoreductase [Bacillus cereus]|uniref:Gfo/Idh/MocA family protein n=1 Tax=Bacillus cereus TaxID=1396 RepID=UPI0035562980|nr:Gfo/Idh/MocA family oxidoreductase [Bacillus cereus]